MPELSPLYSKPEDTPYGMSASRTPHTVFSQPTSSADKHEAHDINQLCRGRRSSKLTRPRMLPPIQKAAYNEIALSAQFVQRPSKMAKSSQASYFETNRATFPGDPMNATDGVFKTHVTPIGLVLLQANTNGLCGLWFEGQRSYPSPKQIANWTSGTDHTVIRDTEKQLDAYFAGQLRHFDLPLDFSGGTAFQQTVWHALLRVPFGHRMTYSDMARQIGRPRAVRALGAALGCNPISVIVPCHRVVGIRGELTGYAGGLDRKRALLTLETV